MLDEGRRIVVIAPDVIVKSFVVAECREILNHWRDGAIVPAVTRELLVCYLRALRGVGLPDGQLRRWASWFTAREKAKFIKQPGAAQASLNAILLDAAVRGNATCILFVGPSVEESPASPVPWVDVLEFLNNDQRYGSEVS
jgi:hypothetical protein